MPALRPLGLARTGLSALGLALSLATSTWAAELSAEERLEAVRQELVRAVLQGATQVQSTAWVDASGALRESSSFRHGMQVRGVRVVSYQRDADGQARAQVQWQGREDTVKTPAKAAPTKACVADARLRHVLGLELSAPGSWSEQEVHLAEDARRALAQGWLNAAESAVHWRLLDLPQARPRSAVATGSSAAYLRLLSGAPATVLPAWTARLRLEPLPPLVEASFPMSWWRSPVPRMRLSMAVSPSEGGEAVFQASADLPVKVQISNWAPPRLAPETQADLAVLVGQWAQALGERLACQNVRVQVLQTQADRVQVDQGTMAGMRVGDEWLLSDRQRVPQRVLEPGAASGLVLAKVERVEAQRAELKVLAGPGERVRPQWQAWPMPGP